MIELTAVCLNDLCGYVDSQGHWRIPPKFAAADAFSEDGLALVILKGETYKGPISMSLHGHSRVLTPYAGSVGLINFKGDYVIPPEFWDIRPFAANGLAYAVIFNKYGIIDASGQWIIRPQFGDVRGFLDNGLVVVRDYGEIKEGRLIPGKWGFVNTQGQWVAEPKFDRLDAFTEAGLAGAMAGDKYGLIDTSGRWEVEPDFDCFGFAETYDSGFQTKTDSASTGYWGSTEKNGTWGFIDQRGQ